MKTTVTLVREIAEDEKFPPQARVIVDTLKAKAGIGKELDRTALVAELEANGKLNTRQEPGRVLSFYQPRLQEAGIINVTKISEAKEKPAKAAPAKAAPAKAAAAPAKAAPAKA